MLGRVREIIGVTELIPDAVILLDAAGGIESMNTAARSLFNLKKEDIGLGLANIVRSPDFAAFLRQVDDGPTLEFTSPAIQSSNWKRGALIRFSAKVDSCARYHLVQQASNYATAVLSPTYPTGCAHR